MRGFKGEERWCIRYSLFDYTWRGISSFYSPILGLDIRYIIIFIIFLSYECFSCLPWSMFEPLMQAEHDIIC